MPMTSLEASTLVLLHCEDFGNSGSVKSAGTQAFTSEPVSTTAAVSKFGSRSIDVYTPNYGGMLWKGAGSIIRGVASTLEGFVYVRNFRTSPSLRYAFSIIGSSAFFAVGITSDGKPYGMYADTGGNANGMTGSSALPLNQWVHIALTVNESGTRSLWVNGSLVASSSTVTFGQLWSQSGINFVVGGRGDSGGWPIDGCVDEVRYSIGKELYTSTFTPPSAPFANSPSIDGATKLPLTYARQSPLFNSVTFSRVTPVANLKDCYYGGRGVISGIVKLKGQPANLPVRRKVWLLRDRDAVVVRETWSSAVDGSYVFPYIDETQRYTVIAFDHTHDKRAVIADNLIPDLMP